MHTNSMKYASEADQHGAGERTDATVLWRAAGLLSCLESSQPKPDHPPGHFTKGDYLLALTMLGYDQTHNPVGWAQDVAEKVREACTAVSEARGLQGAAAESEALRANLRDILDDLRKERAEEVKRVGTDLPLPLRPDRA